MTEAQLVVDPSTISLRTSGPATGDIALVVRGVVFPVAGWNDFVVVILEAWLSALVRLLRQASDVERVHFMEGPHAVDMIRLNTGAIRLRALDRPDHERCAAQVMPLVLAENAASAAEEVVTFCRAKGHRSTDLDRLETALASLRREVENLTN
jgi:hypothetical protein